MLALTVRRHLSGILCLMFWISVWSTSSAQVIWDGDPDGRWLIAENWSDDEIPTADDDVVIPALNSPVVADGPGPQVAHDLELQPGAELNIVGGNSSGVTVSGDTLQNDGTIRVNSNSSAQGATLNIAVGATVTGSGEIVVYPGGRLRSTPTEQGPFTQGSTHTIRGEGDLLADFINEGTITADDADGSGDATLHIGVPAGFGGVNGDPRTNNGVIQSSPTADVTLGIALNQGPAGRLIADTEQILLNTSRINGGTLESENGGVFRTSGNFLGLHNVRLTGQLNLVADSGLTGTLVVSGNGLTNDGTILMNELNTGNTGIIFDESGTLGGSGEIIMNREALGAQLQTANNAVLTLGSGQTVRGTGLISADVVNNGLIIAEPLNGTLLEVIPNLSSAPKRNNGTIRADPGALLRIRNTTIVQDDTTGELLANDSTVELDINGKVVGGRLEATGAGFFTVRTNGILEDVTNNAPFLVPDGNHPLRLGGSGFTNNNTVTVNNRLIVESNVVIDGSGEIFLPKNLNGSQLSITDGFSLAQAPGHTIRGNGQVFATGETFVNNGRLEGNSSSETLEIRGLRLEGTGVLEDVQIAVATVHAPGESVGIVPLEGLYQLDGNATLEIEIGGPAPGTEYDQLNSTGNVTLASSRLNVKSIDLNNGYVPEPGDRFDIITSTNDIQGTFSNSSALINLSGIIGGYLVEWEPIDYTTDPKKVTLELASVGFLGADFDEDMDVDADDLVLWKAGYSAGPNAVHGDGDANGDGRVDGADYLIWQRYLGTDLNAPANTLAVPEPPAPVMVLMLILAMAGISHGRAKRMTWPVSA